MSVAVITSSVGRPELERAIISVQNQTYPCQHYVFVDGKQFWSAVEPLINKYPAVNFILLPMNTGGKNFIGNGGIHAAAPYLVQEETLCFLDDDNWYDNNHIESLMNLMQAHQLDYAYNLRRFFDRNEQFVCNDDAESTGFWNYYPLKTTIDGINFNFNNSAFIDTNCYAIKRETAKYLPLAWCAGFHNDRAVFNWLKQNNKRGGFTAKRTVNYTLIPKFDGVPTTEQQRLRVYTQINEQTLDKGIEHQSPALLIDGQLTIME